MHFGDVLAPSGPTVGSLLKNDLSNGLITIFYNCFCIFFANIFLGCPFNSAKLQLLMLTYFLKCLILFFMNVVKWKLSINGICGADVGISASLVNASTAKFQLQTLKHVETFAIWRKKQNVFILRSWKRNVYNRR